MLYVGLDLSRKRVDYHVLDERGRTVAADAAAPDADGLRSLANRFGAERVEAAIESMNGARFVHDQLELAGWQVAIADAAKTKGLAPLACKTDRIDARVLAELAWRDLVPEVGCPTRRCAAAGAGTLPDASRPASQRVEEPSARDAGRPRRRCPVSDLFGVRGRQLLERLCCPTRGSRRSSEASS